MEHRCGKHAVLANPASRIPVWMECPVHRYTDYQIDRRFALAVALDFTHEETAALDWIVQHGMLDSR